LYLGALACVAASLAIWLAWRHVATPSATPNPEDGTVSDAAYRNAYFDLSLPLPTGWTEGIAGPGPSESGYYVLGTLVPQGELTGTILIAAQDMFFAAKPFDDVVAMAKDFSQGISAIEGMTLDRAPSEVQIAGRRFSRVDFNGVGLYRTMLATEIRCHFVTFNLTTRDPEHLASLVQHLSNLSTAKGWDAGSAPACIKSYAVEENLLHRVAPAAVGPKFAPIPVRVTTGTDGGVRHVHVIRASAEQRRNIEEALGQWKLKPHKINGRAVEVETGVVFEFKHSGN